MNVALQINPYDPVLRRSYAERLLEELGAGTGHFFPAREIEHGALWISAVFASLRIAVADGDSNAIELAVSLIAKDPMWLPFGKLIKSDLSRALKKHVSQIGFANRGKIVAIVVRLLGTEYIPRELEDYVKLIKKFPRSEYADLVASVTAKSEKALSIKASLKL